MDTRLPRCRNNLHYYLNVDRAYNFINANNTEHSLLQFEQVHVDFALMEERESEWESESESESESEWEREREA